MKLCSIFRSITRHIWMMLTLTWTHHFKNIRRISRQLSDACEVLCFPSDQKNAILATPGPRYFSFFALYCLSGSQTVFQTVSVFSPDAFASMPTAKESESCTILFPLIAQSSLSQRSVMKCVQCVLHNKYYQCHLF